ncbi:ERG20 farnesyl diphosphate synthase [Viridothelium virens]|uniref:ERG20 farnesyl diphosphate synthase n=1 Tax=Viridothelium virens TaxID=1048519 RepID=A0A6A6GXL6_VIRVR|nr:ERG20 farnesyl diphosphate synthase [Viridothelium virens]
MPITRPEFERPFGKLVDDVIDHSKQYGLPQEGLDWLQKSLVHNTIGGKYNRGMSVIDTTASLLGRTPNEDEYTRATVLGWMVEMLQSFFLVSDDIMDGSKTRRGSPCWYRMPHVGMVAINDALMIESSMYVLLKKYFRDHPRYVDLMELVHEVTFQTELGQCIDLLTAPEDHVNLSNFNLEKYLFIVRYKTAFYSFYLPVAMALYNLDLATERNLQQTRDILIPMGEYFQVQDDYLDAFADPEVLGKIGTDIQDNKCSWLINQALKRVTPEQRKILDDNYGRKDAICEAKVKDLFHELKLEQVYTDYEEEIVAKLRQDIAQVDASQGLKGEVFDEFLRKIYKRRK